MDILKTYLAPTRVGGPASAKGKAAELQKQQSDRYSIKRLLAIFVAWKTLIFAVASCSAGPGYDTSTQILLDQHRAPEALSWLSTAVEHVVLRLTRWDALYFASGSLHGQVYEQEWAFSWALSKATSLFSRGAYAMRTALHITNKG